MNPDTEPTVPAAEAPKVERFFSALPKRTQVLLGILFVVIILAGAYFIGSRSYYRTSPLPLAPGAPQVFDGDRTFIALTGEELEEYRSFIYSREVPECEPVDAENDAHFASYPEYDTDPLIKQYFWSGGAVEHKVCTHIRTHGVQSIKHIQFAKADRAYTGVGVGSISVNGTEYLVQLPDPPYEDSWGVDRTKLYTAYITELKDARSVSDLLLVYTEDATLLRYTGTDARGNSFERYMDLNYSIHGSSLGRSIMRRDDGTFESRATFEPRADYAATADLPPVSFYIPGALRFGGPGVGSRYWSWQDPERKQLLYHVASDNLEDDYADFGFLTSADAGVIDYVSIKIHLGQNEVINYTTPLKGYVPEQWGLQQGSLSLTEFKDRVREPVAHNSGNKVEMRTIGGYEVKVIEPVRIEQPSYDGTKEYVSDIYQYQVVKGDMVFTFAFTVYETFEDTIVNMPLLPTARAEAIVARVLETFTVGAP